MGAKSAFSQSEVTISYVQVDAETVDSITYLRDASLTYQSLRFL